ncbi:MAG TPA: hypothetical protein VER11_31285 [Polyangiaceae bacterium]|nr:hypothetical protein [Polyangiaceae bacterium]
MHPVIKLFVPCALSLYLASACVPDLDSLSAEYVGPIGSSGSGNSSAGNGNGGGGEVVDSCENGAKDGLETDVDCGGTKCDVCPPRNHCKVNKDCDTGYCKNLVCTAPTCSDKVKNQDETAVDCGGSCPACDTGKMCSVSTDCTGEYCKGGVCTDHCISEAQEADETDVDCGGGSCPKCDAAQRCEEASDCLSAICSNNKCLAPTCSDQTKNQNESDVDCGGVCSATKPCPPSAHCNSPGDCGSWICSSAGKCVADIVVDPMAIIDDFEDGDITNLPPLGGRVGNWYHFSDMSEGSIGSATPVVINRGASAKGLHETGMGYAVWGSGVGADLAHLPTGKTTYDASAYDSVTFWARAESSLTLAVVMPDIDTDPVGMKCDQANTACDHHYYKTVTVGITWQRYTVAFADLVLEPGTLPAPTRFAPEAIVSVQFRMSPGADYDLYLDDVAFLKTK